MLHPPTTQGPPQFPSLFSLVAIVGVRDPSLSPLANRHSMPSSDAPSHSTCALMEQKALPSLRTRLGVADSLSASPCSHHIVTSSV